MKSISRSRLIILSLLFIGLTGCDELAKRKEIWFDNSKNSTVTIVKPQNAEKEIAGIKQRLLRNGSGLGQSEVGYYQDIQQAKFQKISSKNLTIKREGNLILLNLQGQLNFEMDSARLSQSAYQSMVSISRVLNEYSKTLIVIEGHTDNQGQANVNQHLSEQRGLSVADVLVRHGVDPKRLVVIGRGSSKPVTTNDTREGQAMNRRVELYLDPLVKH